MKSNSGKELSFRRRSGSFILFLFKKFMTAFWISLIYVFVAEMGDKTQLVALAFATKFKTRTVLAGVFLATFAVHLISVVVGGAVSHLLPVFWIKALAGLSFIFFGLWT